MMRTAPLRPNIAPELPPTAQPARHALPDWPLGRVIELLVTTGKSAIPVASPEGRPSGIFDFRAFLQHASAGGSWSPMDLVGDHLLDALPHQDEDQAAPFLGMELLHRAASSTEDSSSASQTDPAPSFTRMPPCSRPSTRASGSQAPAWRISSRT